MTALADGVFEYPGTNVYPFEIQTAVPLQDPELLPLLELVLPNGVAIPAQGTVGSDRLVCDLPSTPSGLFSVRNSATHEVVLLAAPGGTSAVAKLQFLWLD